jgi:hypothetical protein
MMTTYPSPSADIERKNKEDGRKRSPQFAEINCVAILKSDVARNENGAFAVLS